MSLFDFLFGNNYSRRARRDQRGLGTSLKNFISPINHYGTCFSCEGSGSKSFTCSCCEGTGEYCGTCNSCKGTGVFSIAAKPCLTCHGRGMVHSSKCRRCGGTGEYRPAQTESCRRCGGEGTFSASCSKCGGSGSFEVSCRKCGGSGWHRF